MSGKVEWVGFVNAEYDTQRKEDFNQWFISYGGAAKLATMLGHLSWLGSVSIALDLFNDCYIASVTIKNQTSGRPAGVTLTTRHSELETAVARLIYYDLMGFLEADVKSGKVKKGKQA